MDISTLYRIWDIQESMREDAEYRNLLAEHDRHNARFLEVVETMTPTQRDAVFDYIGVLIELNLKTLEYGLQ